MASDENVSVIKDKLTELVRQAAETRCRAHTRQEEFTLSSVEEEYQVGQVLGNWMSLILVTGEALKITLKFHFSHKDIKQLIYPIYGEESAAGISDQQSMDFVKELSNLTAGFLEQTFESMDLSLGISLPLGTRGYYELFSDYSPASSPIIKYSDLWRLQYGDVSILGSVMFEVSNSGALNELVAYDIESADEDDGEFDFL